MKLNMKNLKLILLTAIISLSCNDNNEPAQEPELETFLCCGENPFISDNIDNLDQTNGEIIPFPYTTSNQDGYNDKFEVENLDLYPNNTVTIFDLDDNTVYSASDYSSLLYSEKFPNLDDITNGIIPIGTYKYKIVIENEQTFTEYGYFCVFESDTSFVSGLIECGNGQYDPVVAN